jgi:hypothetical protein
MTPLVLQMLVMPGCLRTSCAVKGLLISRTSPSELELYEQKGELEKQLPELARLSVLILLEYFYTKIRFSTPGASNTGSIWRSKSLAGQIDLYSSFKICHPGAGCRGNTFLQISKQNFKINK